jgi:hypothetical protein
MNLMDWGNAGANLHTVRIGKSKNAVSRRRILFARFSPAMRYDMDSDWGIKYRARSLMLSKYTLTVTIRERSMNHERAI